ncbi:hypothetical protein GCM10025858_09970 [Alicyclobacillus sacchari]|nr:hypothetical protein GCM10025858_09970 [Alicyclobacillus sacchari]
MFHAVIGAQYGDEGKGKMVDYLAESADIVVRYQGGGNAYHTIVNEHGKFALHLVPSGIFHKHTISVLGAGVVLHPGQLVQELTTLQDAGIDTSRFLISERAHMVLSYHLWQDRWEEEQRSKKVGTTLQGIGPAYQDKVGRFGLQVGELRDVERLRERLQAAFQAKLTRIPALANYGTWDDVWSTLMEARDKLVPFIADTTPLLYEAYQQDKHVVFEGQLGIMRDLDWGVYPFVTSSNPIAVALAQALCTAQRDSQNYWDFQGVHHRCRRRTIPNSVGRRLWPIFAGKGTRIRGHDWPTTRLRLARHPVAPIWRMGEWLYRTGLDETRRPLGAR